MRPASVLAGLVALEHLGFLVLEMFLWSRPLGLRVFGHTLEAARASEVLAKNQGLYNGFLAAGLIWGLATPGDQGGEVVRFFLWCVVVAGVFGAATASPRILLVQALPALAALLARRWL